MHGRQPKVQCFTLVLITFVWALWLDTKMLQSGHTWDINVVVVVAHDPIYFLSSHILYSYLWIDRITKEN